MILLLIRLGTFVPYNCVLVKVTLEQISVVPFELLLVIRHLIGKANISIGFLRLLQTQITNNVSSSFGQNHLPLPATGYPPSLQPMLLLLRHNEVTGFILYRHSILCMFLKHLSVPLFLICILLSSCFRYLWNKRSGLLQLKAVQ